jgi:hypothetical protein
LASVGARCCILHGLGGLGRSLCPLVRRTPRRERIGNQYEGMGNWNKRLVECQMPWAPSRGLWP